MCYVLIKLLTPKREEAHRGYIFASLFWGYRHFFYSDCYFGFRVFILSNLSLYSLWYFLNSWGSQSRDSFCWLMPWTRSVTQYLLTCGGIQSNHCRSTAVAARQLGLDCYLFLRSPEQASIWFTLDFLGKNWYRRF